MHRKVLFAVKLYDDLTGKVLKGPSFLFYIDGIKEDCIRKPDGYYVFLDKGQKQLKLGVREENYEAYDQHIEISELDPSMPEVEIRLIPKKGSGSIHEKVLEGKIEIGQKELWLFPKNKKSQIKYGGVSKEKPHIMKINLMSQVAIINLNLGCLDQEKDEFDIFRARQKLEHNVYQIDHPLHKKYVMGSEIVRVYHTFSKEDGYYCFYLDDFYETDSYLLVYEEKNALQKIELHT